MAARSSRLPTVDRQMDHGRGGRTGGARSGCGRTARGTGVWRGRPEDIIIDKKSYDNHLDVALPELQIERGEGLSKIKRLEQLRS